MSNAPSAESTSTQLTALHEGMVIPFGGDRCATVGAELAAAFTAGDRLVVVQDSGALLRIPADDVAGVGAAVGRAVAAFGELAECSDEAIDAFFELVAERLADDVVFEEIRLANEADVHAAHARGRGTTRLLLSETMRADMIAGLRMWRAQPGGRNRRLDTVVHPGWTVESWRAPLGVVGFVFEGRPNVFADACGVLRTGNTAVLRIGSDALGTARAIRGAAIAPALAAAGLPAGAVELVDSPTHASGWALFSDRRLALAIARGSGPAVAQLGAVARQHGVPVSLHGTGGAWLVAGESADPEHLELVVRHSLDRKVCNTLNVCCLPRSRPELLAAFERAAAAAAGARQTTPIIHRFTPDDSRLATEWEWDDRPEVAVVLVDSVDQAIESCNRFSPHFVASLLSADQGEHERFYRRIDAPFVGDGFTRWVDGQFALGKPELGLSNWQDGRLFGRGGVLSGDSVFTVRLRAAVTDSDLHR